MVKLCINPQYLRTFALHLRLNEKRVISAINSMTVHFSFIYRTKNHQTFIDSCSIHKRWIVNKPTWDQLKCSIVRSLDSDDDHYVCSTHKDSSEVSLLKNWKSGWCSNRFIFFVCRTPATKERNERWGERMLRERESSARKTKNFSTGLASPHTHTATSWRRHSQTGKRVVVGGLF